MGAYSLHFIKRPLGCSAMMRSSSPQQHTKRGIQEICHQFIQKQPIFSRHTNSSCARLSRTPRPTSLPLRCETLWPTSPRPSRTPSRRRQVYSRIKILTGVIQANQASAAVRDRDGQLLRSFPTIPQRQGQGQRRVCFPPLSSFLSLYAMCVYVYGLLVIFRSCCPPLLRISLDFFSMKLKVLSYVVKPVKYWMRHAKFALSLLFTVFFW